MILKSNYMIV